jgi:hypothetical protein
VGDEYLSSYGLGALGRNYSHSLLTRTVHCKGHVKTHLYQTYNALLHMANIICPFLRILSIYILNRVYLYRFFQKCLFTTTVTTRIFPFLYSVTSSATSIEVFPTQRILKYVERSIDKRQYLLFRRCKLNIKQILLLILLYSVLCLQF